MHCNHQGTGKEGVYFRCLAKGVVPLELSFLLPLLLRRCGMQLLAQAHPRCERAEWGVNTLAIP